VARLVPRNIIFRANNRTGNSVHFGKQKGGLLNMNMYGLEAFIMNRVITHETTLRYAALLMVGLLLMDDFSPTSPKLKQYAAALKPVKHLIWSGVNSELHNDEFLKELCRTVRFVSLQDQSAMKDPVALIEAIMANCVELAFLTQEASGNEFPFKE
jgi:hypothetical protein